MVKTMHESSVSLFFHCISLICISVYLIHFVSLFSCMFQDTTDIKFYDFQTPEIAM
jgi:hypothetical protein